MKDYFWKIFIILVLYFFMIIAEIKGLEKKSLSQVDS